MPHALQCLQGSCQVESFQLSGICKHCAVCQVLSSHLGQRRDVVWDNLDICLRTCPTEDSRLCSYNNWFARPAGHHAGSLRDLPLSMCCMQRLLRFRMGYHKLPRDTGCWLCVPRPNRICTLCQQDVLGDEKHLVVECPALQVLRDGYDNDYQMICFKHLKVMP